MKQKSRQNTGAITAAHSSSITSVTLTIKPVKRTIPPTFGAEIASCMVLRCIKEIFRPEIIAKDAAMVITPIPAILLYTPLCALNYKSKGLKKVKENAYLY